MTNESLDSLIAAAIAACTAEGTDSSPDLDHLFNIRRNRIEQAYRSAGIERRMYPSKS